MALTSKLLLNHYKGLKELNMVDLVFMFSHIWGHYLENVNPPLPGGTIMVRRFWESVIETTLTTLKELGVPVTLENVLYGFSSLLNNEEIEGGFEDIYLDFWNDTFPDRPLTREDIDCEIFE